MKDHGEMVALGSPGELVKRLGASGASQARLFVPIKQATNLLKASQKRKLVAENGHPTPLPSPYPKPPLGR